MSLNWDITAVQNTKELCWFSSEEESEKVELHPVTHTLIWATMLIGFNKITGKNYKDFYRRLIEFEIIVGYGMLDYFVDGKRESRMPFLQEVQNHIGLLTNATVMDNRKWTKNLARLVHEKAADRIRFMAEQETEQTNVESALYRVVL